MRMSLSHSLFQGLKRQLYPVTSLLIVRATLVRGVLAEGEEPVRVLLVGGGWFIRRIAGLFTAPAEQLWSVRIPAPLLGRFLWRRMDAYALAFMVLSPVHRQLFSPPGCRRGRLQVCQTLALEGGWDEVRSRFSRRLRRALNHFESRRGYACRISRALEDFEVFCDRMYVPTARARFGMHANLTSREQLRATFDQGYLLLVERHGEPVAAALCIDEGRVLRSRKGGVLDGDIAHVRDGADVAMYYFLIRHALQQGHRELDCGEGMPLLSDGVVRHKAQWGAVLRESLREPEFFEVLPGKSLRDTRRVLARHPILLLGDGGLKLLAAQPLDAEAWSACDLQPLLQRWRKLGLKQAEVLTDDGWREYDLREPISDG